MFQRGLAYRKDSWVNWDPVEQTVLANEQVVDGKGWRSGAPVEKRKLSQWSLKITQYADELLEDLKTLTGWPEKVRTMQENWIGKSHGAYLYFPIVGTDKTLEVFTTRADTLFGVSYVVLAPEHPLVKKLMTKDREADVLKYIEDTSKTDEIERLSTSREKTGVFIGAYAINPLTDKKVPIFAADYVLYSYGTGAVMGVPAHDARDFLFAKKYDLPVNVVIQNPHGETILPYVEDGILVNSGEYDGLSSEEGRKAILNRLFAESKGQHKVNYRLRDWLVSRQRYWGAPIPVIHCEKCGAVPVPYKDLPVLLPKDVEFRPDGKSPLAKCESFMNTTCPKCGGKAQRDPDTLDTFVCSSWY